jgi:hypothetical protein
MSEYMDCGLSRQICESAAYVVGSTQAQNLAAIEPINSAAQAAQHIAVETRADVN